MPLWFGKAWLCPRCEWVNSVLRAKCRNWLCSGVRPEGTEGVPEKEAMHA